MSETTDDITPFESLADCVLATEGVLPLEERLPTFSMRQDKLGMTHQDWMNSVLARLTLYASQEPPAGQQRTFARFAQEQGMNTRFSAVSSLIAQSTGIKVARGANADLKDLQPAALTAYGTAVILGRIYERIGNREYIDKLARAKRIGIHVIDEGLQLYNPLTEEIIDAGSIE